MRGPRSRDGVPVFIIQQIKKVSRISAAMMSAPRRSWSRGFGVILCKPRVGCAAPFGLLFFRINAGRLALLAPLPAPLKQAKGERAFTVTALALDTGKPSIFSSGESGDVCRDDLRTENDGAFASGGAHDFIGGEGSGHIVSPG